MDKRKPLRLQGYDYSQSGAYFITTCTDSRTHILSTVKEIHKLKPDMKIWQRSYYDHIIRDEADYNEKRQYICTNPTRWADDEYY